MFLRALVKVDLGTPYLLKTDRYGYYQESWHIMQISLPTQCMTDWKVYSGYEHIPTVKYDADLFFTSFFCLLKILSCWADSNLDTRPLICREWAPNVLELEQMNLGWRIENLGRACDGTCWVNLMQVLRWTEEGSGPVLEESLLEMMWGW